MTVGSISGQLLTRFYFAGGGSHKWLSTWLQSSGWPLLVLAIAAFYWKHGMRIKRVSPALAATYLVLGSLAALNNFLFAYGLAYLPASTSALLFSSQLVFNAIFALLITRQRISAFGWNAVVLITTSAVILALRSDGNRLPGVSAAQMQIGYVTTIAAAAIFGLLYPLTELVIRRFFPKGDTAVVLEMQAWLSIVSSGISTAVMGINGNFLAIRGEAARFRPGPVSYYLTLFFTAFSWQLAFVGTLGIITLSSSLLAGVVVAAGIPLSSIFAVIFFGDGFGGLKIVSMLLSLWGFVSYIYGGYLDMKKGTP